MKKNKILVNLKQQWQYYVMLIPGIVFTFIFHYIPLYGLIIAFQRYNPGMGFQSPWVGMQNFELLFRQPNFIRTIWNTLYISLIKMALGCIVPVTVALLLNEFKNKYLKRVFQTLVYLPHFMSWVILAGVMMDILAYDGVINKVLGMVGIAPVSFLGNASVFPWTIIISDVWKNFGYSTIVYLATLTSIDPGLYEAAIMDGANRWKQTIYITIPMLMPIICLMLLLAMGGVLSAGFDQVYNLYSPIVYETGDIIDTYVYRMGIENAQYSVGTAIGLFKSVISGTLLLLSYYFADRFAGYRVF